MTTPSEKGSRGTGSDVPSGGSADRPSGTYEGDESVPQHDDPGQPDFETGFTTDKPRDVEPAIPPYEGRKTVADSGETGAKAGARTGGATAPTTDHRPFLQVARPAGHAGWRDDIAGARATRLRRQ